MLLATHCTGTSAKAEAEPAERTSKRLRQHCESGEARAMYFFTKSWATSTSGVRVAPADVLADRSCERGWSRWSLFAMTNWRPTTEELSSLLLQIDRALTHVVDCLFLVSPDGLLRKSIVLARRSKDSAAAVILGCAEVRQYRGNHQLR